MPIVATDQLCEELTVPTLCGDGCHDVTFSLSAWGEVVEVCNPCSMFPEVLRKLARSDCQKHVQAHIESLQMALQYCQCPDPDQRNLCCDFSENEIHALNRFIARIQRDQVKLAEAVLRESELAEDLSDTDALAAALDPSDEKLAWAIVTWAKDRRITRLAKPIVQKMPDFPLGLQATMVSALVCMQAGPYLGTLGRAVANPRFITPLRAKCAEVLGRKGMSNSITYLAKARHADDRGLRIAATGAIEQVLRRRLRLWKRKSSALSATVANTLAAAAEDETSELMNLLCGFGDPVVPSLISALSDRNPTVRAAAAEALAMIADARGCDPLLKLLDDPVVQVSRKAGDALTRLISNCADHSKADPEFLVRALRARDGEVVAEAARTLGKLRQRRALEPLREVVCTCSTAQGRIAAAEALGLLEDTRTLSSLAHVVEHDADVRYTALEAVLQIIHSLRGSDASIIQTLSPLVMHSHSQLACAAIAKIEEIDKSHAWPHMIRALQNPNDPPRAVAAGALQRFEDPQAIPALVRCSEDRATQKHEPIVQAAIYLIRRLSPETPEHQLLMLQAAKADHVAIAVEAVRLLSTIQNLASVEALLRACLRGEPEVSAIAGPALVRLGGRKWLKDLTKYLEYGDEQVARGIEHALVAVGSDALDILLKVLKWPCCLARAAAARALGRIGDQRATEPLLCARADSERTVRAAAEMALQQLSES